MNNFRSTIISNKFYLKDALQFRSARREYVVDKIFRHCEQFRYSQKVNKSDILFALECFHSSASIIDDIQDGETHRKGIPSYFLRHSYGTSAFASLNLWHYGLEVLSEKYNIRIVLKILRELINAQEVDVGLSKFNSLNYEKCYFQCSSLKISYELKLIYYLSCPNFFNNIDRKSLDVLIEIGKLIQYIDDERDELIDFISILDIKTEEFKLNLSLPIVMAIKHSAMSENLLYKNINKNKAISIYNNFLNTETVILQTTKIIDRQYNKIKSLISELADIDTKHLEEFLDFVYEQSFSKNNKSNEELI